MTDAGTSSGSSISVDIKSVVGEDTNNGLIPDGVCNIAVTNSEPVVNRCVNTTANEFQ